VGNRADNLIHYLCANGLRNQLHVVHTINLVNHVALFDGHGCVLDDRIVEAVFGDHFMTGTRDGFLMVSGPLGNNMSIPWDTSCTVLADDLLAELLVLH
jgi:hypothetical protein